MSLPVPETVSLINSETLLVAMIETVEGRDNVDEIAAVPGIDALLVGCTDLAAELGVPGQLGHPSVKARWTRCLPPARATERPAGSVASMTRS